jgi:hypothetical protein
VQQGDSLDKFLLEYLPDWDLDIPSRSLRKLYWVRPEILHIFCDPGYQRSLHSSTKEIEHGKKGHLQEREGRSRARHYFRSRTESLGSSDLTY